MINRYGYILYDNDEGGLPKWVSTLQLLAYDLECVFLDAQHINSDTLLFFNYKTKELKFLVSFDFLQSASPLQLSNSIRPILERFIAEYKE